MNPGEARLRALEMVARAERRFRDEMWAALSEDPGSPWSRYASTFGRVRAIEHHLELVQADLELLADELAEDPENPLLIEVRRGFRRSRDDLRSVRAAGRFTLDGMELEMDWARKAGGVDPEARASLREGMELACTLADESARFVTEHVNSLEDRMRRLDVEARERRDALREVEDALS